MTEQTNGISWLSKTSVHEPWSSSKISPFITQSALSKVITIYNTLEKDDKLKLLFSFLSLSKHNYELFREDIMRILDIAKLDDDEWVKIVAGMLSNVMDGYVHLDFLKDNEDFVDVCDSVKSEVEKNGGLKFYPLENAFLSEDIFDDGELERVRGERHFESSREVKRLKYGASSQKKPKKKQRKTSRPLKPKRSHSPTGLFIKKKSITKRPRLSNSGGSQPSRQHEIKLIHADIQTVEDKIKAEEERKRVLAMKEIEEKKRLEDSAPRLSTTAPVPPQYMTNSATLMSSMNMPQGRISINNGAVPSSTGKLSGSLEGQLPFSYPPRFNMPVVSPVQGAVPSNLQASGTQKPKEQTQAGSSSAHHLAQAMQSFQTSAFPNTPGGSGYVPYFNTTTQAYPTQLNSSTGTPTKSPSPATDQSSQESASPQSESEE